MSPLTGPDSPSPLLDKRLDGSKLGVILAEWSWPATWKNTLLMKRAKPSRHYATGGMKKLSSCQRQHHDSQSKLLPVGYLLICWLLGRNPMTAAVMACNPANCEDLLVLAPMVSLLFFCGLICALLGW